MRARGARELSFARVAGIAAILVAPAAFAQAWLPEQGAVGISLDYTYTLNKEHYLGTGAEVDIGHTTVDVLAAGMSWSPADRVLLRLGLPLVQTQYDGSFPHPGEVDDGGKNRKLTDLQASVHYQLVDGPFAFSPYLGFVIPVQDYTVLGHAAPGRGLNEFWAGYFAALSLNAWIPRTYAQMRHNYAIVEEVAGISHNRSNVDLEFGYFINPDWSVRVLGFWQDTHGGVQIPIAPSHPLFPFHDQLAEDDSLNVGGGIAWRVSDRMSVHTLYVTSLSGENSHKVNTRIVLGTSWILGGR